MIEEYARHNGHADLLRERIDGVTGRMYEPRSDHATGDVTFLEMKSPEQLQPASEPSLSLDLEEIDPSAAPVVRATYVRIGTPLSWSGRMAWSEEDWRGELS